MIDKYDLALVSVINNLTDDKNIPLNKIVGVIASQSFAQWKEKKNFLRWCMTNKFIVRAEYGNFNLNKPQIEEYLRGKGFEKNE